LQLIFLPVLLFRTATISFALLPQHFIFTTTMSRDNTTEQNQGAKNEKIGDLRYGEP
jgi:hypothetical protein